MKVGHEIESARGKWSFDGTVADTFVDHVRQSVPLSDAGHDLIASISDYFVRDESVCYEIGTSPGPLLRRLAEHHSHSRPDVVKRAGTPRETGTAAARRGRFHAEYTEGDGFPGGRRLRRRTEECRVPRRSRRAARSLLIGGRIVCSSVSLFHQTGFRDPGHRLSPLDAASAGRLVS